MIGPLDLYHERISSLIQLPSIQYSFGKGLFKKVAQNTIKQYLTFTMSGINDDDNDCGNDDDDDKVGDDSDSSGAEGDAEINLEIFNNCL